MPTFVRRLVLAAALVAGVADARANVTYQPPDLPPPGLVPMHGVAVDGEILDVPGASVVGFGLDGIATLGHGRWQLLGEVGAGVLLTSKTTDALGVFTDARVGGRFLVATVSKGDDLGFVLALDAGVGGQRSWLHDADAVNTPYAFLGWTTLIGGEHHAMTLSLRITAAPKLDDPTALRAICRGTCTGSDDAAADYGIKLVFGVMSW